MYKIYRIFAVITLVVQLFTQVIAPARAANFGPGPAEALATLVKRAVNAMIVLGGIVMAGLFAFTNLAAVIARGITNKPHVEADATLKLIMIAALFGLLVFAIPISNAIVSAFMSVHSKEDIYVPMP